MASLWEYERLKHSNSNLHSAVCAFSETASCKAWFDLLIRRILSTQYLIILSCVLWCQISRRVSLDKVANSLLFFISFILEREQKLTALTVRDCLLCWWPPNALPGKQLHFCCQLVNIFDTFSKHSAFKIICMHISVYRDSSPKNFNYVINYSPSYRSKPTRHSFIYQHKLRYYWWNPRAFWPCIDSLEYFLSTKKTKIMTLFNNFFSSMSVFNRCPREYHCNVFLHSKSILVGSQNYCWTTDATWIILTMSLLCFWALNVLVSLLSLEDHKVLGFYQKYLNLCSEDEWKSHGVGTTWGRIINDSIFFLGELSL